MRHFACSFCHAMPPQAEAVSVRVHHPRHRGGMDQRTRQRGVHHGPDAQPIAQQQRAQDRRSRNRHWRQSGQRKAVKGIQHGGAVAGDAGDQHHRQQRIEEPHRKIQLGSGKMRANQRKKSARPRAIRAEAAISSKHIHSMELDSSCCARSWPSRSLTRISVGTSA